MAKIYITNGITTDGFGARMDRCLRVMAYTKYFREKYNVDIEYIHTPFSFEGLGKDYHDGEERRRNEDNEFPYHEVKREDYLKRAVLWDKRMNYLGLKITDIDLDEFDFENCALIGDEELYNKVINISRDKIFIIELPNTEKFPFKSSQDFIQECSKTFGFERYNSNEIILHIRRKELINFYQGVRYLDDAYYLNILEALKPYKDKYEISIRAQRKNFNSELYGDWKIYYDDEEQDYDAFVKMANAKVLVISVSSMSIAAGALNPNVVVYPSSTHNIYHGYYETYFYSKWVFDTDLPGLLSEAQKKATKYQYNSYVIGKVPVEKQRPEIHKLKELGYQFDDAREIIDIFENKVAKYAGSKYAVATDCCSHGLFLALTYIRQKREMENLMMPITIPKRTYISVPMQIVHVGFPVGFDDREWSGVYQLIGTRIWDGATRWTKDMYVGNNALQILSFQYKKRVPIGKGGMIITDDEEAAKMLKLMSYDGRNLTLPYDHPDHIKTIGYHMYMTPEDAARGIILMDMTPEVNDDVCNYTNYIDVEEVMKRLVNLK